MKMDARAVEKQQLSLLNKLFDAIKNNSFYSKKFESLKGKTSFRYLQEFFERVPLTAKSELTEDQTRHPPFGTDLTYPLDRYSRFHQTSGSSGTPMRWLDTEASWQWMVGNWQKVFKAAGTHSGDIVFFAFSFGPFLGFWTAFEAATSMGCLSIPGGGLSTLARLRMIVENRVTTLCCTPTYALRLGEAAREAGMMADARVKTLIVAGEPGGGIVETRKSISSLWQDARVVDHHGMTEVGPVSHSLAGHQGILKILEDAYIAEVLEPDSVTAVKPGRVGELVLTTLGRTGSPLIRYRTGDLVKPWESAPRGLESYFLDGGILGRIDDMLLIRGVNIYPSSVESVIRRFPQIVEYRVTINTSRNMGELFVEIETSEEDKEARSGTASALAEELKASFALRIPVSTLEKNTLPRFEMKAKRWIVQN